MNEPAVIAPRKLIEVALPLDAINEEGARRKRKAPKGYPTAIHKWWAQRPIAVARAVLFAQLVNDPSWKWEAEHPGETPSSHLKATWAKGRRRLFGIIEKLVLWENTANEAVLTDARAEIRRSWRETCEANRHHPRAAELFDPERVPPFHDPFAGGGSIPLEAQRLGLETYASDLNPVAVLINKAMIEIPPKFVGSPPVNPDAREDRSLIAREWRGAQGLAEDLRYYGRWIRDEAEKRIGHLYPKVEVTAEMALDRFDLKSYVGQKLTVVACLWARTVKSPNPAFADVDVPLASTFMLSTKAGKEAYVNPVIESGSYRFEVRTGRPRDPEAAKAGMSAGRWNAFRCLMSGAPITYEYIRGEGVAGRMGARLMAIVAEGVNGRIYLSPSPMMEEVAHGAQPSWKPDLEINYHPRDIKTQIYGLTTYGDLFTPRQLVALTTISDLVGEARERVRHDAVAAGVVDRGIGLEAGSQGAEAYGEAVSLYLGLALGRLADYGSSIATWRPKDNAMRSALAKQAIPMTWDFAEGSPFGASSSGFVECVSAVASAVEISLAHGKGNAFLAAAQNVTLESSERPVVSTDPPYYDNIGYADLSDFFYVWLRRILRPIFPNLFGTLAVPKAEELVATPYRHGGKEKAEAFFLRGMTEAMVRLAEQAHPAFPVTIYYAFKQSETEADEGTASSGWETFLEAVLRAGFAVSGTWPMRTEGDNRQTGIGANALASSVVLVCRPRVPDASTVSRREFTRELARVLPEALDAMTRGANGWGSPVAPVDLSQAIIGPGMKIFSRHTAVLEADGAPMTISTALKLINRYLADDDFDAETQFCLGWFEQHGWQAGPFGSADTLARAKGMSVDGVKAAGVIESGGGSVRLKRWDEYPADWDPSTDSRTPVWEAVHHLIRSVRREGEQGAGRLLAGVQGTAGPARQLAYRLYTLCERAGRAEDARAYNELISSWSAIETAATSAPAARQTTLFDA
jgi:putative DNA methylase